MDEQAQVVPVAAVLREVAPDVPRGAGDQDAQPLPGCGAAQRARKRVGETHATRFSPLRANPDRPKQPPHGHGQLSMTLS